MLVRLTPNKATMAAMMVACKAADLALSAAVRVALEWQHREQGRPLPQATDRHRAWSAKAGDAPKHVLFYMPKAWDSLTCGEAADVRRSCMTAVHLWLAAGAPVGELSRTTEQLRLRARSLKDNADVGAMHPVKLRLGKVRAMVVSFAQEQDMTAATLVRRIVREAFHAKTGRELPEVAETPQQLGRTRADVRGDLGVSMPIAWLVQLDAALSGSRTAWIEAAVCARFGVEMTKRAHTPTVAAMVEARQERMRYAIASRSSAPRPEMVDEAREQSRWPAGRGVFVGAITGRQYVGPANAKAVEVAA